MRVVSGACGDAALGLRLALWYLAAVWLVSFRRRQPGVGGCLSVHWVARFPFARCWWWRERRDGWGVGAHIAGIHPMAEGLAANQAAFLFPLCLPFLDMVRSRARLLPVVKPAHAPCLDFLRWALPHLRAGGYVPAPFHCFLAAGGFGCWPPPVIPSGVRTVWPVRLKT